MLPPWDRGQDLFQYPEVVEQSINSVPIENQANPIKVLSDVILSNSMNDAIVNRLSANPTYKPIYRQTRLSDMRIVAHKSAGLAAQNFMTSMAAIGYDTCPMEGSDTLRVKQILKLPRGAEINMVISCGIRDDKGIYGPRFRVPFEEVYIVV